MPVAIGPIHTPLTYPEGIYKNRGFCPRLGFRRHRFCSIFLHIFRRPQKYRGERRAWRLRAAFFRPASLLLPNPLSVDIKFTAGRYRWEEEQVAKL